MRLAKAQVHDGLCRDGLHASKLPWQRSLKWGIVQALHAWLSPKSLAAEVVSLASLLDASYGGYSFSVLVQSILIHP